ncbi:hypothetical protein Scep_027641 [Stephania cephalantha]|uniref:Uncharacterized protein n=1 Tax=Stephania cephalantha TaxID=152367 RepID=A0AAP0HIP6_9MAGN
MEETRLKSSHFSLAITSLFLLFHKDQLAVANNIGHRTSSSTTLLVRFAKNHSSKGSSKKFGTTSMALSLYHTMSALSHSRRTWFVVSSFALHNSQQGSTTKRLLYLVLFVSRAFLKASHKKVLIFSGPCQLHISFHALFLTVVCCRISL